MASYVAVTPVYSLLLLLLLPCTLEDSILECCITLADLLIECMMQSEVYMLPTYVFYFTNWFLSTGPLGTYLSFMT